MGAIGKIFGGGGGDKAAKESRKASEVQARYQREALEYLKEREELPQAFREGALTMLGGMYGLEGGEGSQQQLVDQAMASPLYGAMMEGGEGAILRQQAATGGLRSGDTQAALASNQNQALLTAYNQQLQGLQGLAGTPTMAPQIAGAMGGIGQTLAQGRVAAAQAQAQGSQAGFGNLMGLGQLGMQAYQVFSDPSLKTNIEKIGEVNGWNWYSWEWNKKAESMGITGKSEGVMADEVKAKRPDLLGEFNGIMTVNMREILHG